MSLSLAWITIISFTFFLYIVLDGFTLGIGIMLPFFKPDDKDIAVSTILPTWDGNQTWLVFSLAALYGMFPIAFAYILPKIYLPALLLAGMLLFRGICFEFRLKSIKGIKAWDITFSISSIGITFIHGYLAGQIVIGYHQELYSVGLSFKIFTGLVLVMGYMLLGSTRLMLKTEGNLLLNAQKISLNLTKILPIFMALVGVFTFYYHDLPLWNHDKLIILFIIGILIIIDIICLYHSVKKQYNFLSYWLSVILFTLSYLSMLAYIFPYIIPYKMTYHQASAAPTTLAFTLIIACIMIPVLLVYTGYSYYIFRGKTKKKLSY